MDSSEKDKSMEPPIQEAEPEVIDLADEEGLPSSQSLPVPAPPLAVPGMYWCEQADPGVHPALGQLVQGENDFTQETHPDKLAAIAALVDAGVLRPM